MDCDKVPFWEEVGDGTGYWVRFKSGVEVFEAGFECGGAFGGGCGVHCVDFKAVICVRRDEVSVERYLKNDLVVQHRSKLL